MNVEIDKHDLFRNIIPGYVFIVVILSFFAVTNRLDSIEATPKAIIGLVAGFPLGFLIHAFYRIVFHFWSFGFFEQRKIEREDMELIDRFSTDAQLKIINDWFLKSYGEIKDGKRNERVRAKAFSHVFDLKLSHAKDGGAFTERIYFLISFVHSLGASSLAIVLALFFIVWIKFPLWYPHGIKNQFHGVVSLFQNTEVILATVWILGAIILYLGRKSVKQAFTAAKKAFYLNLND